MSGHPHHHPPQGHAPHTTNVRNSVKCFCSKRATNFSRQWDVCASTLEKASVMIGFQNMRNRKVVFVKFIRDSFIHQGKQNKNKMKVNHCIFRQTHFKVNYCSLWNCRVSFAIFHGNSFFQLSDQFRFFLSKL